MTIDLLAAFVVALTVGLIFWIDKRHEVWLQKVLTWFPAMLLAYVVPAAITHIFNLDLTEVWLHQLSRNGIIPLAIVTLMSALPLGRLLKVGWKPIALFLFGSMVIAILPVVIILVGSAASEGLRDLFFDQGYWKGLVPIVGSWIGGSTSQLVLRELVECPNELFLSVIVIDNLLVNIWTLLMFQVIRSSDKLNTVLKVKSSPPETIEDVKKSTMTEILFTVFSLLICTGFVTWIVDGFVSRIAILSIVGLALANSFRGWSHSTSIKAGGLLILLIMSILGLRLDFTRFDLPAAFVVVCIMWLLLHYLLMLLAGWGLRIHMAWLPIASMANLGGISTAPAVTAAYNRSWMPHAVLLAVLSMVTGNLWGFVTISLFRWLGE